jgi:hypothetical protein
VNYKKLVVMLCLGSYLLATNSIAIAGWNPFKKMKKAINQVTKPIENATEQAAAAARDAANRAAQERQLSIAGLPGNLSSAGRSA